MPTFLAIEWGYLAARFPEDVSVRYSAGLWMLDAHRYQDAVAYLRSAMESQQLPGTVRGVAFESLGLALIKSGHIAEAEAPLRAALKQTPPDLRAYCSLTEMYKQSGRFEEAAQAAANCPGVVR
jgi:Flp pilus assembly protein TadD